MINRYLEKLFYWKIFNKNWNKPKNLIEYLIKKGFICIGQGWYSTTYTLPNSSYVIKINSGDFDYGYAYYIDICLKYYTPYNHLPKILKYKKYNFDKGQNFYFVLLPKYTQYPIMDYETDDIKNIRNNLFSFCPVLEKNNRYVIIWL